MAGEIPPPLLMAAALGILPSTPYLWMATKLGQPNWVRTLLEDGADIEEKGGKDDTTPLHEAALHGHEPVTQLLLAHEADVSSKDAHGETPLGIAARQGHETVARLLIEHRADVSAKTNKGETALIGAAGCGLDAMVGLLIQHQADVSSRTNYGKTALIGAARGGHETTARLLIQLGADVLAKDFAGMTALHYAAMGVHETVMRTLIELGADIAATDIMGQTVLHCASHQGHETVVRLLLDAGADEQDQGTYTTGTPEILATDGGHHQVAAILKAEGVRRAQCVAFAMGHHARLGVGSRVEELDPGVVRMVLDEV